MQFDTVDRASSDYTGDRFRIESISGREIVVKVAWYSREDVEEMRRLLRDRIAASIP